MKSLFICSTYEYSGKSLISMGLGVKALEDGYKVGYFKPLGKAPKITRAGKLFDEDAELMRRVLNLRDHLEKICPVVLTEDLKVRGLREDLPQIKETILAAYKEISQGKDLLLLGGVGNINEGAFLGVSSLYLAKALNTPVLLVDPYTNEVCIDCILAAHQALGPRLLGVVLNKVKPESLDYVESLVKPFMARHKIEIFGVIPQDRILDSLTVRQLQEVLGGEVLCAEDHLDELVERFLVGTMDLESAQKYLRRTPNKAVITGGQRADILLAALETSTRCLIVTGDLRPNDIVVSRAEAAGVPIIAVREDTLTAVEKVERAIGRLHIREERKIIRGLELVRKHVDLEKLYKALGLK